MTIIEKWPTLKAIHICNSHEPTLDQKLQKSMSLPRHRKTAEKKAHTPNKVYKSLGNR